MTTIQGTSTYIIVTCSVCGIHFGMPEHFNNQCREKGVTFYCPGGHTQWYGESTSSKLQKSLERQRERTESERRRGDREAARARAETRSHASTKGHLTRQKKRAPAGVCPCCNRTFKDMANHMKDKHPKFVAAQ